jgi:hypothetical protein
MAKFVSWRAAFSAMRFAPWPVSLPAAGTRERPSAQARPRREIGEACRVSLVERLNASALPSGCAWPKPAALRSIACDPNPGFISSHARALPRAGWRDRRPACVVVLLGCRSDGYNLRSAPGIRPFVWPASPLARISTACSRRGRCALKLRGSNHTHHARETKRQPAREGVLSKSPACLPEGLRTQRSRAQRQPLDLYFFLNRSGTALGTAGIASDGDAGLTAG